MQNFIIFKRFNGKNITIKDLRRRLKDSSYESQKEEGYVLRDVDENSIYADYIFRFPTLVNRFDDKTFEFVREKATRIAIVGFSIDTAHNLLSVFSRASGLTRLITDLGRITELQLAIDDVVFSPRNVQRAFRRSAFDFSITSLKVKNFAYGNEIVGTYTARIKNEIEGDKLINAYHGDIAYFGGNIKFHEKPLSVGFYQNGALRIFANLEESPEIFDEIKNSLFAGEHNA